MPGRAEQTHKWMENGGKKTKKYSCKYLNNNSGWTVVFTLERQAEDLEGAFAWGKYGKVLNQISKTLLWGRNQIENTWSMETCMIEGNSPLSNVTA